jgi:F0F1-type ATP synthase alpha subunit
MVQFHFWAMELGLTLFNKDGIARLIGLEELFQSELVVLFAPLKGLTLNLSELSSDIAILGNDKEVEEGELAERLFLELVILVGFHLIGSTVDAIGNFIS